MLVPHTLHSLAKFKLTRRNDSMLSIFFSVIYEWTHWRLCDLDSATSQTHVRSGSNVRVGDSWGQCLVVFGRRPINSIELLEFGISHWGNMGHCWVVAASHLVHWTIFMYFLHMPKPQCDRLNYRKSLHRACRLSRRQHTRKLDNLHFSRAISLDGTHKIIIYAFAILLHTATFSILMQTSLQIYSFVTACHTLRTLFI